MTRQAQRHRLRTHHSSGIALKVLGPSLRGCSGSPFLINEAGVQGSGANWGRGRRCPAGEASSRQVSSCAGRRQQRFQGGRETIISDMHVNRGFHLEASGTLLGTRTHQQLIPLLCPGPTRQVPQPAATDAAPASAAIGLWCERAGLRSGALRRAGAPRVPGGKRGLRGLLPLTVIASGVPRFP